MSARLPYSGVLIDDQPAAKRTADLLSFDELELEYLPPGDLEEFAQSLFDRKPALVILDYRLDERAVGGRSRRYKASALAQQLRDLSTEDPASDFPIVLHSAEEKLQTFYPERTAHDLFDFLLKKGVGRDVDAIRNQLVGLAEGYKVLIAARRSYADAGSAIFGLDGPRAHFAQHQEILAQLGSTAVPHVLARFILKSMLRQNAILLDLASVAARAGVAEASREVLGDALTHARVGYTGVFARSYARWWRQGVDAQLAAWLGANALSLTAEQRAERLSAALAVPVAPARSTWSRRTDEPYTHACFVCHKPTHPGHSVAILDRGSGILSQQRRWCFDCLQRDRKPPVPVTIDALDARVADEIRTGARTRPNGA